MKKLTALLVAAMFSLTTAMPVSAASADDTLVMAPTTKVVKSTKKHKKIKKAKHKRSKVRAHKRARRI